MGSLIFSTASVNTDMKQGYSNGSPLNEHSILNTQHLHATRSAMNQSAFVPIVNTDTRYQLHKIQICQNMEKTAKYITR